MWADDCFRTTFGLACRQRLDVSKIHIHVGHDVLQRNFVEDWLDYVVAVSRVVLALAVFILNYYPLFPPKKKSDAEKADIVRAELEQFLAEHGQMPSQHADLPKAVALYMPN